MRFREMLCYKECTAGEGLPGLVSGWEGPPEEVPSRLNPEACPGVVHGRREKWDKDDELSWQRTGTFQHSLCAGQDTSRTPSLFVNIHTKFI